MSDELTQEEVSASFQHLSLISDINSGLAKALPNAKVLSSGSAYAGATFGAASTFLKVNASEDPIAAMEDYVKFVTTTGVPVWL